MLENMGVPGAGAGATDPDLATRCDYDDDLCQSVVAVIDDHLDAVDHQLAEAHVAGAGGYTGPAPTRGAKPSPGVVLDANKAHPRGGRSTGSAFVARRPQDFFDVPVDNSNVPFLPPPPVTHPDPRSYVPSPGAHPLREELDDLAYPDDACIPPAAPIAPAPTDATPCVFVDTPEALEDMVAHLDKSREMAVDLEHHSYRSFQGFTCVIQVSTRTTDFVVDALELRGLIRDALGPVMADPSKMKVFHGADMDVQWLQRDFGIYVVGMFDTGQAARVLELPSKGLAYLLDHYCGVKADKRFQLADWRIRPLSEEMISYARGDTHHLLYVYDRLRQQLDAVGKGDGSQPFRDLIRTTLDRSRDVCATLYEKPVTHALTYHADYRKNRDAGDLDLPRLAVYAALHGWRDERCRAEDESIGYVLPRALMLRMAREAPTNPRALLAVTRGESPLVAKHSGELVDIISRALAAGEPPAMPPTAGEEWAREEEERKNRAEEEKKEEKKEEEEGVREETLANATNAPRPVAEVGGGEVGGASAMAAMMGTTIRDGEPIAAPVVAAAAVAPGEVPRSSMARLLSAASPAPVAAAAAADDDDAKASRAASRVAEKLRAAPVSLAELFPHWHRAKGVVKDEVGPVPSGTKRVAGGHAWAQRKNKEEAERAAAAAIEDGAGDVVTRTAAKAEDDEAKTKTGDDARVTLPGGYTAPAPLRKGAVGLGTRREAQREEAEREAVVKARAEEARNALASRRKAAMASMMDSSDESTDEDEDARAKGVSRADQDELLAIGKGGFDFAAAAAAVLPDGGSFRTLGAEARGGKRRRGKGARGERGGKGADGRKEQRKRAPGLIETVKPGKKSKAFPRSGEKSATFR